MGENTKIEWADHSWNPWIGCTKVSPACDNCYAEALSKRAGAPELWKGARRRTSAENWRLPIRWNKAAAATGQRPRVFCASMADVFDNQIDPHWRADLWALIAATPNLDWLLLTKRPQNIAKMLPGSYVEQLVGDDLPRWPWPNVWLGATVENQEEAERRISALLAVPAAVHFLSCEPLLGMVDISKWLWGPDAPCAQCPKDADCECEWQTRRELGLPSIDWVICGGESGGQARPMHPVWARVLRDQCDAVDVPFLFKQWGEWLPFDDAVNVDGINVAHGRTCGFGGEDPDGNPQMVRAGKKKAGRLLDGREWNDVPVR
jgi:protein gp37